MYSVDHNNNNTLSSPPSYNQSSCPLSQLHHMSGSKQSPYRPHSHFL